MNRNLLAVMLAWAVTVPAARADDDPPLALARAGSFYVGGHSTMMNGHSHVVGQMYVEMRISANQTRPSPIIMVHGGTRTGTTLAASCGQCIAAAKGLRRKPRLPPLILHFRAFRIPEDPLVP
jgi:hypothetical protein